MPKQAVAFDIEQYVVQAGLPRGPKSAWYIYDPVNGSALNPGTSYKQPLAGLEAAYALTTGDQHDAILALAGDTGNSLAAAVTWSKDHTHLIGLSGDLPGMGQRCRITGSAAADLAVLMTISGNANIFKNLQLFQGGDAATALGCAVVSGSRNYFKNVFFAGGGHATPAADAGMYSLTLSGSENYFEDCTIGLDTVVRAAANSELIISGARNHFRRCRILSNSVTAGKFLVKIDNSGGDLRWTLFEDCVFINYTENWANGIDNVFDMPAGGSTHYVILKNCQAVGVNSGWADTVTHIYSADPAPNAGFGLSTNPTT